MLFKTIVVLSCVLAALALVKSESPEFQKYYSQKDLPLNGINLRDPRQQATVSYRLPNDTKPLHYDISLTTNVHTGALAFSGLTKIFITAKEPTNVITLHALQITISKIVVSSVSAELVNTATGFTIDTQTDFLRIPVPTLVVNNNYTVEITYTSSLRRDNAGFYLSTYTDSVGVVRYLATTQFEQTDARHAFPCYDEPAIRATYSIDITHDASYTAISNMPGTRIPGAGNTVKTVFDKLPSVQTYLVAFIVSDFTFVSNAATKGENELLQQVFGRPTYIANGDLDFSLKAGVDVLIKLEELVGQKYSLPKMDQAAIPDFAAGAMENWGLVTYRETALRYVRNTQPMTQEKSTTCIIAHEYAHQFFGDWVSPVWWSYLWLNEGFATLFEYYAADKAYPDYKIWDLFNTEVLHYIMDRDNTVNIRPMTYYVEATNQLGNLFDSIAYDKSGTVLRMFLYAFGETTFLKGLKYYLEEMEDKAADSVDLSRGIEKAAREDGTIPATVNVVDIIHSWSEQSGFPILHVSRDKHGVVTLKQERFLSADASAADRNKMWWLPYNFAIPDDTNFENTLPDDWMTSSQQTITLNSGAFGKKWTSNDWMIFNKKQTSYYRVNYDSNLWSLIIRELHNGNFNQIHYTNRAQLLEDAFKLARLNRLNYDIVFGLISSMHKELEYLPWAVFNNNFGDINLYLSGSPNYEQFRSFIRQKIEPYYRIVGPANRPTDKLYERQGRIIAMNYACRMGSEVCRAETSQKLEMHLNAGTEVEIDIRAQVYCNGLRGAATPFFLRVWEKMLATTTDQTLRNLITTGLGCSEIPANLETLLSTTIDGTTYLNGDRGRIINAAFGNTNIGLEATLKFITEYYQQIHEIYEGTMPLSSVYASMGQRIVSTEQLERFRSLGQMLVPTYVSNGNFNSGISRAETNLIFVNRNSAAISNWVVQYNRDDRLPVNYRLPNDTIPIHYDISLSTNIHNGDRAFSGEVKIEFTALEETKVLTLHAMQMIISSIRITTAAGVELLNTATAFTIDSANDFLSIPLPNRLTVDARYFVEIKYTNNLRQDDAGFYVSSYQVGGATRYLATTQFEQTDARHAFPCYDEPSIRATYTIDITHDASYNAVSNMPGTRTPGTGNTVKTQFEMLPSVQTYLIAFIVSDFTFISNAATKPANQLLQQVFARPEYIDRGDLNFSLQAGIDVLNTLQEIVNQPYRLPKMDQAAIPDFTAGAMENWGLVTYRESALRYDPTTQPMTQEKSTTCIIAHEFAHQYFGDFVSPVWWSYIWLNEGFATLFEYYSADKAYPDYKIWDLFQTEVLQSVMNRDNTVSVRPMTFYREESSVLRGLFDFIAYDKSGTVMRMFMYAFGEQTFLKGLSYYLGEMDNKAATSVDLSRGIQKAVTEDRTIPDSVRVEDIIHSWSEQSGFPILHVSRNFNGEVTLRQERFLNADATPAEKNKMWWLPYNFAVPSNTNFDNTMPDSWLSNTESSVTLTSPAFGKSWSNNDWMIFNKKQTSYYRVNYDNNLWNLIIKALHDGNYNAVHYASRSQLLEDAFKLAAINRLSYDIVFGLMSSMHKELEFIPWSTFNNNFANIDLYMSGSSEYAWFKDFVRQKIEPYYRTVGPANRATDKLYERQGRAIAMNYACRMGSTVCRTETTQKLDMHLNAGTEVEIDIRSQLYCGGLRAANTDLFLRVWNKMLSTTDQTLRGLITTALGCSEDPALLQTLLSTTLDGTTSYTSADKVRVLNAAFANTNIGLEATISFIETNYQRIHDTYGVSMPLSSVYAAMGQRVVSNEQLGRFQRLGQTLVPTYVSQQNFNTAISRAEGNLVFVNRNGEHISEWIVRYMRDDELVTNYRLPNDTVPIHYDISLTTHVHTGERGFDGHVAIEIMAKEATNAITMHAMQITIIHIRVHNTTNVLVDTMQEYSLDPENDFLRIPLPSRLVVGNVYTVEIEYTSLLRDDEAGFYISSYRNPSGTVRYLATTQFEQTDARHAFPCYDEPAIRATYSIDITHDASYTAISNMPGTRVPGTGNTVKTVFDKLPSVQTYLVAFIVSDFTFVSNANNPSQLFQRVFARPEFISRGEADFALTSGIDILTKLQSIVQQQYKLPKMDQAAIPDFAAGAMENWGLVTYRESALLYNPVTQPMTQQKQVTSIVSHEFAHQFFGDFVSPIWWSYLWLNEGFARMFEYYLTDATYPDYKIWDSFQTETIHYAMDRDSAVNVRPMTFYVEETRRIGSLFDFIAYDKSACVLRTFMYAFGEQTFLKGLKYYLGEMEDKAATSSDLSRGLQQALREDRPAMNDIIVENLIHSWSEQSGFPILHVSRDSNGVVTLRQERFLNTVESAAVREKMWWLPFNFAVPSSANFEDTLPDSWLTNSQSTITLTSPAFGKSWTTDDWMIFNKKQTSYYRVNYDDNLWKLIVDGLHEGESNAVHFASRAQLLEDAFKLARLDRLNYDVVFGLISSMHKNLDYIPWSVFNNNFGDFNLYLGASPNYESVRSFIRQKIEPYYRTLGPANRPTDKLYERQGRVIAMNYACRMGSEVCRTETTQKLETHINAVTEVEIDIRSQLYCNGLRGANADLFLRVWNKMLTATDAGLRNLIITGLGCSEDPELLNTLLSTTLDSTNYNEGDRGRVLSAAFGNTNIGLETTLKFVEDNYLAIHNRYDGATPLSSVYVEMGRRIVSNEQLTRYRALGQTLMPNYLSSDNYQTGQERANANMVFVNAHSEHITGWISDYLGDDDDGAATITVSVLCISLTVFVTLFR